MGLLYNAIKTPDGTVIESFHRHDYVCHKDANGYTYCVDGGLDYQRRTFTNHDYEDLSVEDDGKHETRRSILKWGKNYDKYGNRLPETVFTKIKDLETEHILAILAGEFATGFHKQVLEDELRHREEAIN